MSFLFIVNDFCRLSMIYFAAENTEEWRKFDGELRTEDDVGEGRCLEHNVTSVGRK